MAGDPIDDVLLWTWVGNFDAVLTAWRQTGGSNPRLDGIFLEAAVTAAVKRDLAEEAEYLDQGM
jgi:AmpE protein